MPHLKIEGAGSQEQLFQKLELINVRDSTGVQKIRSYYLDRDCEIILAEALVADGGLPRNFFIEIRLRENVLTVRCLAVTDPEKTPAVKRLIVRLGLMALAITEGGTLGNTNLESEIDDLRSEGGV
jgi:hypothetical protein